MNKLLKFRYTKDGMLTNPENRLSMNDNGNEFVSVNELHGVLSELISEKNRMLENYKDTNENSPEWNRIAKAEYEAQKAELEKIKKMLY